jgi:hypothetical protein
MIAWAAERRDSTGGELEERQRAELDGAMTWAWRGETGDGESCGDNPWGVVHPFIGVKRRGNEQSRERSRRPAAVDA